MPVHDARVGAFPNVHGKLVAYIRERRVVGIAHDAVDSDAYTRGFPAEVVAEVVVVMILGCGQVLVGMHVRRRVLIASSLQVLALWELALCNQVQVSVHSLRN